MCRESRPVSRLPVWRRCRLDFTVVEKDGCADGVDGFATDDPRDIDRITSLVQVLPTCAVVLAVQLGHALASAASPSASQFRTPCRCRCLELHALPAHLGGRRVHTHMHFNSCTLAIGGQHHCPAMTFYTLGTS
jgi:hypothetical protein